MSGSHDKTILAYMQFLTAVGLHNAASQVPVRMRSITSISSSSLGLDGGLSWRAMCMNAMNLFDQVKNECWFELSEGVEELDEEVKHLPLSGHICFMKGQVCELLGRADQALQSFQDAAHYYRIACGNENLYVASVLHRMGLCSQSDNDALGYFNEALSIRKNHLGVNSRRVSETLFSSAVVLARLNRYAASMERYHEALRIQMIDSQDSNDVARTLTGE
jgi:tetratricopeptide (TPR) repeat protein